MDNIDFGSSIVKVKIDQISSIQCTAKKINVYFIYIDDAKEEIIIIIISPGRLSLQDLVDNFYQEIGCSTLKIILENKAGDYNNFLKKFLVCLLIFRFLPFV